jgi:hypothetical protein
MAVTAPERYYRPGGGSTDRRLRVLGSQEILVGGSTTEPNGSTGHGLRLRW